MDPSHSGWIGASIRVGLGNLLGWIGVGVRLFLPMDGHPHPPVGL